MCRFHRRSHLPVSGGIHGKSQPASAVSEPPVENYHRYHLQSRMPRSRAMAQ
ncbi:hypothetical protein EDWATA_00320 [Edwardsiella tarda ATCC 23685]|uniref:Uncharacterized protein n=1 Tax=Edwardsiella tarda ATCC 23685 TaxID=500638 RepID=D4F0T9_EDWTA|nr:hypothetical protein EDWATA_00320 [Edwardsiella tarda ATCC 23685]